MKIPPRATRKINRAILRILLLEKSIQVAFEKFVVLPHTPWLLLELVSHDHRRRLVDVGTHAQVDVPLYLGQHRRVVRQLLYLLLLLESKHWSHGLPKSAGDAPLLLRFE